MKYDSIVAGHLCLDITPTIPNLGARSFGGLLVPGKLVNVGNCTLSTGGAVSNTGIALAILGQDVALMGKVGNDGFGEVVRQKMAEYGLADSIITVEGEETSYTIVLAPPGIDRAFLHNPGANDSYCADDIPYDDLVQARHFHFGYPTLMRRIFLDDGKQLVKIFKRVKQEGLTTSLDMTLPDPQSESGMIDWRALLTNVLPYVDIFVPSIEETLFCLHKDKFLDLRAQASSQGTDSINLIQPGTYSQLSAELIQMGVGIVTLKAGHRGFYARSSGRDRLMQFGRMPVPDLDSWSNRELWAPTYHADTIVSATGAGDCAIAGFLASFSRGECIEDALLHATMCGTQNIMTADALSGLKPLDQTRKLIHSWEKDEVGITDSKWTRDDVTGIWSGPCAE